MAAIAKPPADFDKMVMDSDTVAKEIVADLTALTLQRLKTTCVKVIRSPV